MAIELLSRLENWRICNQNHDIRGFKLLDDGGTSLGTVRDLIVNTETGPVRDEFLTGGGMGAAQDPDAVLRVRCERM
jgi:hypothetical protein